MTGTRGWSTIETIRSGIVAGAPAAYYDAERERQIGPDDGFKAQVLEFTEEDERSIRAWVRYNARTLFEDGGE